METLMSMRMIEKSKTYNILNIDKAGNDEMH